MTYNVEDVNPDRDASLDAIERADVDVVLLQEITAGWQRALVARFAARYPHRVIRLHRRSAGGLAVLSKLPLRSEELLAPVLSGWFPAQRVVIEAPFGPVQILHLHLRPPYDGGWIKGFLTTPPLRRQEIEVYWQALAELPTIVAGDFNEDPTGLAVQFLEGNGLARAVTTGPTTWHYVEPESKHELLKMDIDHVMIDPRLVATGAHVVDAGCSDHRPVIVTIDAA